MNHQTDREEEVQELTEIIVREKKADGRLRKRKLYEARMINEKIGRILRNNFLF